MVQIALPKVVSMTFLRTVVLIITVLLGIYTAFASQASSPDYRRLFWSILPVALGHFALAFGYFVRIWTRWVCLCFAIVVIVFFGEMMLRVWL